MRHIGVYCVACMEGAHSHVQAALCLHVQETLLETPGRPPVPEGHIRSAF